MSTSFRVLPYSMRSTSARSLADALEAKLIKNDPHISKYRPSAGHIIINFGCGEVHPWMRGCSNISSVRMLNSTSGIILASNKIEFFKHVTQTGGVNLPTWTLNKEEAKRWLQSEGDTVYCRGLTRASQGRGITVAHSQEEVTNAPLYTKGINVKREYRAHVVNGEVIDLIAKTESTEITNTEIRNHTNGWVFTRNVVTIPESTRVALVNQAIGVVESLGLDFAAVDLLRDMQNNIYVLEVNTAPGMEGTTLERYVNAFKGYSSSV